MSGQSGASRVGCLLAILILVLVGYGAVQFVGKEIDYQTLRSEAQDLARQALDTPDQTIREGIQNEASRLELPVSAGHPTIRRTPPNHIQITIQYPDSLTLFHRWYWVRQRRIEVDLTY